MARGITKKSMTTMNPTDVLAALNTTQVPTITDTNDSTHNPNHTTNEGSTSPNDNVNLPGTETRKRKDTEDNNEEESERETTPKRRHDFDNTDERNHDEDQSEKYQEDHDGIPSEKMLGSISLIAFMNAQSQWLKYHKAQAAVNYEYPEFQLCPDILRSGCCYLHSSCDAYVHTTTPRLCTF